ncbi:MAG: DUF364 domain-containing protein [Deltaproteobacteria bacterium]|nr:DUF364 domain-containing protein [Deltaproteobacteria bacterium]
MEILKNILSRIEQDAVVGEILRGLYWTAVVSRFCGLSSTLFRDCDQEHTDNAGPFPLTGGNACDLAQLCLSPDIGKASLGLAAINSLVRPDSSRCTEVNAGDILMEKSRGKNVSIIGHFPFVDDLKGVAKNLWVIEKWQKPGDYPEEDAETYLPQSDIIAISSTTLINHTLEDLLPLCPEKSYKMLLGPTTPMTDILFSYGIDIISGSQVTDTDLALTYIKQGANFRQLKRSGAIKLLSMVRQ